MSIWWNRKSDSKRVLYSASVPWFAVTIVIGLIATFIVIMLARLTR